MRTYTHTITLLLVLAILSCTKKEEQEDCTTVTTFDRKDMVSNITTQYILPAYNNYLVQVENMVNATDLFLENPTEQNLETARFSWKKAARAWQSIAFLEFGPAENIGLRSQTNIYPVDTSKIEDNIIQGDANIAIPTNFDAKGFQSIEYLLFNPQKTDLELISYFASNTNAVDYLKSLGYELNNNAVLIKSEWTNYSEGFIKNTSDNAQGSAVSSMVNSISAHYETFVRKGKLGLPVGIFNGFSQTPMPGHVEALYSGNSLYLLKAQMEFIKSFINGKSFTSTTDGQGLDDYMNFVEAKKGNESLSKAINNQIDLIISGIDNLNTEPLSAAVINQSGAAKALYQNMQKLVPLIKVDLTSALGVLITYQDNDGD